MRYDNFMQVWRKRAKLSQWELGQMLHVGQEVISKWETGKELPPFDKREEIARILKQDLKVIFP